MVGPSASPSATVDVTGLVAIGDGGPHLIGSRCGACATETFPAQASCPSCGSQASSPVGLPRTGTIWTWTVQRFAPKPPFRSPKVFEPFAVGYVDLGTVRVESRLGGRAVGGWKIGDRVVLAVGDDGGEDPAFWFEPLEESQP